MGALERQLTRVYQFMRLQVTASNELFSTARVQAHKRSFASLTRHKLLLLYRESVAYMNTEVGLEITGLNKLPRTAYVRALHRSNPSFFNLVKALSDGVETKMLLDRVVVVFKFWKPLVIGKYITLSKTEAL